MGKKAAERRRSLDVRIAKRISEQLHRGSVNFYQKARLGSQVKDELASAGYPEAFSKEFVVDLVSLIAVADTRKR